MKPTGCTLNRVAAAFSALLVIFLAGNATGQGGNVTNMLFLNGNQAHVVLPTEVTDNLVNTTVEGWVKWESFKKWARVFDFGKESNAAVLQNERATPTLNFSIYDQ